MLGFRASSINAQVRLTTRASQVIKYALIADTTYLTSSRSLRKVILSSVHERRELLYCCGKICLPGLQLLPVSSAAQHYLYRWP